MTMRMGADSVYTYTKGINFADGTVQTTAAPSSGSSGANVVQATGDFGSDSGPIKRSFDASAVVSASWVTNTSVICCSIAGVATGTHGTEDALIEGITVQVESVVAGVGFTLHAYSPLGSWGQYSFNCIGI